MLAKMKSTMLLIVVMVLVFGISTKAADITYTADEAAIIPAEESVAYLHFSISSDVDINRIEIINITDEERNDRFCGYYEAPMDDYIGDHNFDLTLYNYLESGEYSYIIQVWDDYGNLLIEDENSFIVTNESYDIEKAEQDRIAQELKEAEEKAKAEEEARRKAEEEAQRAYEQWLAEQARLEAEEEARRKAEEEAQNQIAQEETESSEYTSLTLGEIISDDIDETEDLEADDEEEDVEVEAPTIQIKKIKNKNKKKYIITAEDKLEIMYYNGKKWKKTSKKTFKLKSIYKVKARAYRIVDGITYYSEWVQK